MKVRINNIECRLSQNRYEIVRYFPNIYFGKEKELIEEGYEKTVFGDGLVDFALSSSHHTVHGSCFADKESCCVIAVLDYNEDGGCCDLTTIGSRVLKLDEEERKAFFDVYGFAEEMIYKLENKNEKK